MFSEGWGGAERLFVELCTGLAAEGHEIQVLCRPNFDRKTLIAGIPGITCVIIPARGKWDLISLYRMKQAIAAFRPQLIHAHLGRATWMAGQVGRYLQIPTVTTTHNRIKAKNIRKIDYFTTITRSLGDYLCSLGFPADRIRHIPNFSLFAAVPAPAPIARKAPVFFSLGRFVAKKGYRFLIEAFAQVVTVLGPETRLMIAGSGPQETTLKRLVAERGLTAQVEFLGWIDNTASLFAEGDIFVLPSLDEPFGIVLLEAMAQGKVIVTTRTGGPLDLLDESLAYFVEPESASDLARGMLIAALDPEGSLNRATLCLDLFRSRYTRDQVLPAFVDFFAQIAESRRNSPPPRTDSSA